MVTTLNEHEVELGDIMNAYVQAPVTEKMWTTLGPEFGKDTGKTEVVLDIIWHKISRSSN